MPRTRLLALLAIAVVAGLTVTGCKSPMGLSPDTRITSHSGPTGVYTIWAGQHDSAGYVTVWFDETTFYIKYQTTGNWWIEETHADVQLELGLIPQKNGNPIPGKFEFKDDWKPRVQTCTYEIPIRGGWDCGVDLYIATHCVVAQLDGGKYKNQQTGWAGPNEFPGKNWALYIKYKRMCYKDPALPLPTYTVQMRVNLDGGESQFAVELKGVPSGFDVWNETWLGWCGERGIKIPYGIWFDVTLVSSQDPNLPERFKNSGWHKVNYLLNHKHMKIGEGAGSTFVDVQIAAWYLLGQWTDKNGNVKTLPSQAQVLVDEANENAGSWQPAKGDWIAVICVTPTEVQSPFIEVDP